VIACSGADVGQRDIPVQVALPVFALSVSLAPST
jgi:hypothetical protein